MKKISVIVNKNWETEPVLNAMVNPELKPSKLNFPDILNSPKDNKMDIPRAVFNFSRENSEKTMQVKIWCIQDLMYFNVPNNPATQSSSSSEEKFRVLGPVLKKEDPDLIIAVGTAGYPDEKSVNGSVVIGANFFLFDGHPGNPRSRLSHPDFGKCLKSNVNDEIFSLVNQEFRNQVESKFIATPRNPAEHAVCMASKVYTTISTVNITDYDEYNWVDDKAISSYNAVENELPIRSSETTLGIVKLSTDKPIIFMAPITDLLGNFDTEITPTQNYVASFNAGIVLGQLLCSLNDFSLQGKRFRK